MTDDIEHLTAELLSIVNDGFLLVDDRGRIVFANEGATHLTGYDREELVGENFQKLVPKALLHRHQEFFRHHMENGPQRYLMGKRGSVDLIVKDGSKLHVGISLAKKKHQGHVFVGVVLTDYTDMGTALANFRSNDLVLSETVGKLERAKRRLTFAQTLSGIGSWDWDIQTGELFWSDEVYNIFGLEPGETGPTYDAFLNFIHPDDRAAVAAAVQSSLDDPAKRYDIIHRINRACGGERIVREMGMVEVDEKGQPAMMVGSVQDITEAEALKQKTEEALMREMEASRTKTEFLANLSHELRTPLNAVVGFSTLLKEMNPDALQADNVIEYATYIHEAGSHLHHLVDDILEVSRIDMGIVELKESEVDLGNVARAVQAILNTRAMEKGIAVIYDFELDLPFRLDGDELRLKQVLLNLMGNSVKFSPRGSIITVGVQLRDDNGIQIMVADNGPGMSQDQVERAFGRFDRAESAMTRTLEGGLGLGLPLSQSYMRLHDATITIETAPGEGMTVMLDFPPERTIFL